MKTSAARNWANYAERLSRVTAYVYDHLDDEELDLNRLAGIACLSPYHWHRIYTSMYGETVAAMVKRLRLHRAAGLLANSAMPVADVARRSGYPNLQSFTRVFKAAYGLPPAQYRHRGGHTQFTRPLRQGDDATMDYDVSIQKIPAMTAVTVPHTGPYMDIGKAFQTLYLVLGERGLLGPGQRMVAIYFDDPSAVEESKLRSCAGVVPSSSRGEALTADPPLEIKPIRGGEYAVLRHQGPYADLRAAYQWLYGEWLPASGREAADAPAFEEYLNTPRDTPPAELVTLVCLPLR